MIESVLITDLSCVTSKAFVTLTYPEKYPQVAESKKHLRAWWQRLVRKYGKQSYSMWRAELQARGAVHYHLMVFDTGFLDKSWLSQSWFETCGTGDQRHLAAGTKVEKIRSLNGVVWYVSKYMTKESADDMQGRSWGWLGRKNRKLHPEVVLNVDETVTNFLGTLYDTRVKMRNSEEAGFSLYGRDVALDLSDALASIRE